MTKKKVVSIISKIAEIKNHTGLKIMTTHLLVVLFLSLLLLNFLFSASFDQYVWNGIIFAISAFLSYLIIKSIFKEIEFDRKILEETQKSLEFEHRFSQTVISMSGEIFKK